MFSTPIPYHIVRAAQGNPTTFTPSTKTRKQHPIKGPSNSPPRPRDNPSLTGWSQVNSPNASGIVGETFRYNGPSSPTNRPNDTSSHNSPEKIKEGLFNATGPEEVKGNCIEEVSLMEPRDVLCIDTTGDIKKGNELPIGSKRSREVILRNLKTPVTNKHVTVIKTQKSADFNNIFNTHNTARTVEFPLSIPASPAGQPREGISQNLEYLTSSQLSRTSYSKLLSDPSRSIHDFKVFRMAKLKTNSSHSTEKRASTVVKSRPQGQVLYVPTTVLNGAKLVKQEDTGKQKNPSLSRTLYLWSPSTTPQGNASAYVGDSTGFKYSEPLSVESPAMVKAPGMISTKVFSFVANKQEGDSAEVNQVGPMPHFKTTMKVRKLIEDERPELEISNTPSSRFESMRMRQTSPIGLFPKRDSETRNESKRKSSRNIQRRSEVRRRPTNEMFQENAEAKSQCQEMGGKEEGLTEFELSRRDLVSQRMVERIAKIVTKKGLENKELNYEGDGGGKKIKKNQEPKFVKVEMKGEVDGKDVKKKGKNVRIGSSSMELAKGIKEMIEIKVDLNKINLIKSVKVFENKP